MKEPGITDFDLDAHIARWRMREERTSSLSPRELDELEDHLRARVTLALELDAALEPAHALRDASREIGAGPQLSAEFARAGTPRWKALFVAGWALFAASFALPASGAETLDGSGGYGMASGFELLLRWLGGGLPFLVVLFQAVLPNFAMLSTIRAFRGGRLTGEVWLRRFLGLAGAGALGLGIVRAFFFPYMMFPDPFPSLRLVLGSGYWTWAASMVLVAAALHLRARTWDSADTQAPAPTSGRGAIE